MALDHHVGKGGLVIARSIRPIDRARSMVQQGVGKLLLASGLYKFVVPLRPSGSGRRHDRLRSYILSALAKRRSFEGWLRVPYTPYQVRCNLRDWVVRPVLSSGMLKEHHEVARFVGEARPGDVVLDVGANIGLFAFSLIDAIRPAGKVHLFEPNADLCRQLRQSIRKNRLEARMCLHEGAVTERSGERVRFMIPRQGSSSVGSLTAHEFGLREGHLSLDRWAEVSTMSLDALSSSAEWDRVDLVKIDVEGAEEGVLLGAMALFRKFAPRLVLVETAWGSRAHMLLTDIGYRAWVLDAETGLRAPPPAGRFWGNIFFSPHEIGGRT